MSRSRNQFQHECNIVARQLASKRKARRRSAANRAAKSHSIACSRRLAINPHEILNCVALAKRGTCRRNGTSFKVPVLRTVNSVRQRRTGRGWAGGLYMACRFIARENKHSSPNDRTHRIVTSTRRGVYPYGRICRARRLARSTNDAC